MANPALHFAVFYVSDMEESLKFFTEKLGFEHDPAQDAPDFRGFKIAEGSLPFGLTPAKEYTPHPGTIQVYFKTNDLEGQRSAITDKGVKTSDVINQYFGSFFGVEAPDGLSMTMLRPAGQ